MSDQQSLPLRLLEGQFIDGPFVGLTYQSASQRGVTSATGKFSYQPGEVVTFFIGSLDIGSAVGAESLTLANLIDGEEQAGTRDPAITRPDTINRARFVHSLGREDDLRDGVTIDDKIREVVGESADKISFDSDADSFEHAAAAVFKRLDRRFRGSAEVQNHLRRAEQGIKLLRDVRVPLRDGNYLEADVFHPSGAKTDGIAYPALVRLSIYGRAFTIGSRLTQADYDASEDREAAWYEKDRNEINPYFRYSETGVSANASTWVPRGYALVRVDGRGVGHTPGKLHPFSKQEALDYYDAIQWTAHQPWCDGNVGLYGGSYNATIQWNVAALNPPALKAMAPLASDSDSYRELAYPGGILLGNYRQWWFNDVVGKARNPNAEAVDLVGGLRCHPFDDQHYNEEILSADFSKITIPVLTSVSQTSWIHGRAGFEAFSQLSTAKQLLVWDASYTSYMYQDSQPDMESFFDRYLKGKNQVQKPAVVRFIQRLGDGEFEWREGASWPLPGTEYRELFLVAREDGSPGQLTTDKPKTTGIAKYSADVRDFTTDPPMAVFETAPLTEDLELAGHFRATLWMSSSSSDADVYVAIRVIEGEREVPYRTREPGSAAPLTWGCLKASHRAVDPARSTPERPWHTHRREDIQPLPLDQTVEMEIELLAATGRIQKGRRLRVEVSPIEGRGRLPGWERDYDESYHRGAVNRVFTGGVQASSITIPVVLEAK
ncbi:hypothetical protein BHE90_016114 [Fusarium euwallaceae]|uniref:Xaa-Pro dipeptidyl-peptidase C-terminal domain-containing protein n=1 Tax=Fusarium euwallaceae TaxID=1147111 RepID=A0A430L1C4_9HYPO|nr:hypothetical protein BHE90_016114 [Fusarium euwallaceae]